MTTIPKTSRPFRGAGAFFVAGAVFLFTVVPSRALEADLVADEAGVSDLSARIGPAGERRADAIASYARGIFEEETLGPDSALESFKKTLELDPGFVDLAIRLSQDYLRKGDPASAIAVLKDSRKALPQNPEIALALSVIYLRHLEKTDLALQYAQAARKAAPDAVGPLEVLAEIHAARGENRKTAALLARAAGSQSKDPQYWLGLADLTARRGATDPGEREGVRARVLELLDRGVRHSGDDPELLSRAGDLFALSREVAKAVEAYERAYEKKASLPKLREKLAAGYIELGRQADAVRILDEIINLDPLDLAAYDQLAQLHMRAGDFSKAAASACQALLIEPQSVERHLLVIDLLFRDNDFEGAAGALAEARKIFPAAPRLAYFHGLALSQSGKHDEALAAFATAREDGLKYDPGLLDAKFYFDYGAAAEQADDLELAAAQFRISIDKDPANPAQACNYLGYMWVEAGIHLDEAEQLIRRALAREPENGAYIDSLGWLYFKQGKYEDALATLLRAAGHLPEPDPVVYEHIGDACSKLGRTAEAILYWRKARELDPENAGLAAKIENATSTLAHQPEKSAHPPKSDQAR